MSLVSFHLEDEFQDAAVERAALLGMTTDFARWEPFQAYLRDELFPTHADQLDRLRAGLPLELAKGVEASLAPADIEASLAHLEDLALRRRLARLQQDTAARLYDGSPVDAILDDWETRFSLARLECYSGKRSPAQSVFAGSELAAAVLDMAQARQKYRIETGRPYSGILSGLTGLDRILNGFNAGLHLLAAGPGAGKTTLALQFAWQAARAGKRVVYLTYENSPSNLMLKLLCAQCGANPAEIERGYGDAAKLEQVAREHAAILGLLSVHEGGAGTRVERLEADFLIVDYLQRAAHGAGYEQMRHNVSSLTSRLREWAMRRNAPALAISSLNRAAADYGKGGSVQMENLKESGDLEYGADTVSLLYPPAESIATPPARDLELRVAKNRFGPLGSLRLIFRPDTGVFRERT